MIENSYAAILSHDTLKIKHPASKRGEQSVELKRIIATKSFNLYDKFGNVIISVQKYDIGGFVESIDNLDPDNPVWVDHSARIFDNAKLLDGSYARNNALLYESAIASKSILAGHCRVHGTAIVHNSTIQDLTEVKDSAYITDSCISNNSKVYENAQIVNSQLLKAASAHGNCKILNSNIGDICEIRGTAEIENCNYKGRVIKENGQHVNQTLERELNLSIYEEVDEDHHKQYNV